VEISNTGTFNFLSWNTGTALIIADVPYTAGSYIYIPSSSDTNESLGIVNTNTSGSIMLMQGSGNTNNFSQLYVNNSGTTINNILGGISKAWTFGTDGSLTFPQGGTLRVSGVPAHSTGAVNDKAGTVAFDNDYIYYCTADYAPTQYSAETRLGDANGVDSAYLIPNSYQLPSVGWIIYYNNQTAVINQVNNGGNPGYYTVFTATPLFIPANTAIQYGPPSADIWKRTAHGTGTW
jgi:hypothetical protein